MKYLGKMWYDKIKIYKNANPKMDFILSLKDTFLEKPWGGGGERVSVTPSSTPAF